jgi:putative membrane protein
VHAIRERNRQPKRVRQVTRLSTIAHRRTSIARGVWGTRPHQVGSPPDPRFSLANERTFLAWNRTALALIAGGLAAAQLLRFGINEARLLIGLPLIVLGGVVGVAGIQRWRVSELALRLGKPLPRARLAPGLLGAGTGIIAGLALIVLILDQLR